MWAETNWAGLDTAGLQVVLVGLEPSLAMVGAREWVNLPVTCGGGVSSFSGW